jgi:hypothetical protein
VRLVIAYPLGVPMPTQLVNLDAMIPREDFEEKESNTGVQSTKFALRI